MLLHQPRDILYSIISFLEYTPDTARLGRACKTLDCIPNWYERSGHRQPHQVHEISNEGYFYAVDGRTVQTAVGTSSSRPLVVTKHSRFSVYFVANLLNKQGRVVGNLQYTGKDCFIQVAFKKNGRREVDNLVQVCKQKRTHIEESHLYGGTIAMKEVDEQQGTTTWFHFTKGTRKLVVWHEMVRSPESDCISIFRKKESIEEKWWGVSRQYKAAPSTYDREQLEESELHVLDDYDMLIFHTS
jgi:hypothetical protein